MKSMILSDLLTVRKYLKSQTLMYALLIVAISIFLENIYMITPFFGVMLPFSLSFTLFAYDERNRWEQFRLALPLSRSNVIAGRYASLAIIVVVSVAIGLAITGVVLAAATLLPNVALLNNLMTNFSAQAIALTAALPFAILFVMLSITLPLTARFGMTKAIRFIPLIITMAILGFFAALDLPGVDFSAFLPIFDTIASMLETLAGTIAISGAIVAASAVIYLLSAVLSVRLYAKREF